MEPNPRVVIGNNSPPGAVELAEPTIEALSQFLKDFPVIANEKEAREAKALWDRIVLALKGVEDERKSKVDPLNAKVKEINGEYHRWHHTNDKTPGTWDTLFKALKLRLSNFARKLEAERQAAAEAAVAAAAEAERKAREAEERERETAAEAALGICGGDIAAATQEANDAFVEYQRADRISQRAEKARKVRIGGGFGKVSFLRDKETLTVTDWRAAIAAIEEISDGLPAGIEDAILTGARACRKLTGELPPGIQVETERTL